jgi:uncharacterized protein (DUF305 family)
MGFSARFLSLGLLFLPMAALAQPPAIIQPGAPGKAGRTLTTSAAAAAPRAPFPADIDFMSGMIMHHGQAVEMADLLRARGRSKALQALGKRISISQTDEMKFMKQWLAERGHPVMEHDMKGMDRGDMKMDLMPGMLTPQQMKTLAKASGPAFDKLFLTGMIQHHNGALIMVQDLFDTPGAGQDAVLFDFASDVDNTQRAEIGIMQGMLKGVSPAIKMEKK